MKVIKRDGRIQDFDINKILLSVENASDGADAPMASSDISNIGEDVQEKIDNYGSGHIHSSKIHKFVVEALKKLGFSIVADYYDKNQDR